MTSASRTNFFLGEVLVMNENVAYVLMSLVFTFKAL